MAPLSTRTALLSLIVAVATGFAARTSGREGLPPEHAATAAPPSAERLESTVHALLNHLRVSMYPRESDRTAAVRDHPQQYYRDVGTVIKEACEQASATPGGDRKKEPQPRDAEQPLCEDMKTRYDAWRGRDVFDGNNAAIFSREVAQRYLAEWKRIEGLRRKDNVRDDPSLSGGERDSVSEPPPPPLAPASTTPAAHASATQQSENPFHNSVRDREDTATTTSASTTQPRAPPPVGRGDNNRNNAITSSQDTQQQHHRQWIDQSAVQALPSCRNDPGNAHTPSRCCRAANNVVQCPNAAQIAQSAEHSAKLREEMQELGMRLQTLEKASELRDDVLGDRQADLTQSLKLVANASASGEGLLNHTLGALVEALHRTEQSIQRKVELFKLDTEATLKDNAQRMLAYAQEAARNASTAEKDLIMRHVEAVRAELMSVRAAPQAEEARLRNLTRVASLATETLSRLLSQSAEHTREAQARLLGTQNDIEIARATAAANLTAHFARVRATMDRDIAEKLKLGEAGVLRTLGTHREWLDMEARRARDRAVVYKEVFEAMQALNRTGMQREARHELLMNISAQRLAEIEKKGRELELRQEDAFRRMDLNRSAREQAWWARQEALEQKHKSVLAAIEKAELERAARHADMQRRLEAVLADSRLRYVTLMQNETAMERERIEQEGKARQQLFEKVLERGLKSLAKKQAYLEMLNQKVILNEKRKLTAQREAERALVRKELDSIRELEKTVLKRLVDAFHNKSQALLLRHQKAADIATETVRALQDSLQQISARSKQLQAKEDAISALGEKGYMTERQGRSAEFQKEMEELMSDARDRLESEEKAKSNEQESKLRAVTRLEALRRHQQEAIKEARAVAERTVREQTASEEGEKARARAAQWPQTRQDTAKEIKSFVHHVLVDVRFDAAAFVRSFKRACFDGLPRNGLPGEMCDELISNIINRWASTDLRDPAVASEMAEECASIVVPYVKIADGHALMVPPPGPPSDVGGGGEALPLPLRSEGAEMV